MERRGVLTLVPLLLILLALVIFIEVVESPKIVGVEEVAVELHDFDPNNFEYEELRAAGVPTDVAVGIVRWRRYGKVYRIKEDLAQVSGMTDSIYSLLKPHIIIADSLTPQPYPKRDFRQVHPANTFTESKPATETFIPEKFLIDTASAQYLTRWGFSAKQAAVVVRYRDANGGICSAEQFRRCYVVSEEMAEKIIPYIVFSQSDVVAVDNEPELEHELSENGLIDINMADSAELVTIDGIGPRSAMEIIKYRNLLGGYHSVEQIAELKCVTESNFEKILPKICCDSFVISKIDINFAGPKELGRHPYVSAQALRRIIKQRQLKGGWRRIEEMTEQNILSDEEAERLAPYLRFGSVPPSR